MLHPGSSALQYAQEMTEAQKVWVIQSLFVLQYNTRRKYPVDRSAGLFQQLADSAGFPSDGTHESDMFANVMQARNIRPCPRNLPRVSSVMMRKLFIDRCRTAIECRVGEIGSTGKHISLG